MAAARSAEQNDSEVIGVLTIVALVTAACLVLLPAMIVGVSAAEIMRRRRLRWTWALAALGACLVPLALFGAEAVAAVRTAVDHELAGRFDATEIACAGAPWWLAASCLVAGGGSCAAIATTATTAASGRGSWIASAGRWPV